MTLMFYAEDCDALYKKAIAAGSKSLREPTDQFYGDRMAGVEDPFGFQWYIATHIKDMSPEEMKAAMAGQAS
jgi:PhnB protein